MTAVHSALAQAQRILGNEAAARAEAQAAQEHKAQPRIFDPERHAVNLLNVSPTGCQERAQEAIQAGDMARALPDLELFLEGAPEDVELVARWFEHGPPDARVDRVEVSELPLSDERGFVVL